LEKTRIDPLDNNKKNPDYWGLSGILLVVCISFLYILTAGTNGVPLITNANRSEYFSKIHDSDVYPEVGDHYGYYNLLADAFEAGRLSLPIEPKPELLALPNPYDANANAGFRLHDASLKDGKYYLYFGAVPALLFFLPFRLLGLGMLSEPLAVALLYCGILWLSYEMVCRLCKEGGIRSGWWQPFSALTLGFGGATLYILRRPVVYEVAIVAGSFFSLIALRFLFQYFFPTSRTNWKWLALSGLAVILAIGSRPNCVLMAPLIGLAMLGFWILKPPSMKGAFRDVLAFGLPIFIGLMLIFAYNYARFGNWREFGMSYQLPGPDAPAMDKLMNLNNLLIGGFHSLFAPPQVSPFFPYIIASKQAIFPMPSGYLIDRVIGISFLCPVALATSVFLACRFYAMAIKKKWGKTKEDIIQISGVIAFIFGVLFLGFTCFTIPCSSMRYLSDSTSFLLIGTCLGSALLARKRSSIFKICALSVLAVSVVFSIGINTLLGFSGYYDLFKRGHPITFATLESYFEPIAENLGFSRPRENQILDIVSNKGVGRTADGAPYLLLGRKGGVIRVFASNKGNMKLTMDYAAPDIATPVPSVITASLVGKNIKKSALASSGRQILSFPLEKGVNWISFKAENKIYNYDNAQAALIIQKITFAN
jgi:hypothetical protein